MLSLVARWANAWNCAWYGVRMRSSPQSATSCTPRCAAEGRDPSAVEVTVGIIIGDGERRVPRDRNAIAQALAEWQEQGIAHVICSPDPTDAAGVALLYEAARQFRAA